VVVEKDWSGEGQRMSLAGNNGQGRIWNGAWQKRLNGAME